MEFESGDGGDQNVERECGGLHHLCRKPEQAHHCQVAGRAAVTDRRVESGSHEKQDRQAYDFGNGHLVWTYILGPDHLQRHRRYMTEYAIDIVNVTKRYAEHVAVRDLTLRVPKGSVYGLLGPNGAGKTTTIRMILNIIAPDSGSIRILGKAASDPRITEQIGYLPEERGLYRKMQVRRVLRFLAELKGMNAHDADKAIDQWLVKLD